MSHKEIMLRAKKFGKGFYRVSLRTIEDDHAGDEFCIQVEDEKAGRYFVLWERLDIDYTGDGKNIVEAEWEEVANVQLSSLDDLHEIERDAREGAPGVYRLSVFLGNQPTPIKPLVFPVGLGGILVEFAELNGKEGMEATGYGWSVLKRGKGFWQQIGMIPLYQNTDLSDLLLRYGPGAYRLELCFLTSDKVIRQVEPQFWIVENKVAKKHTEHTVMVCFRELFNTPSEAANDR